MVGPRCFHEVGAMDKDMIMAYPERAQDGKPSEKCLPKPRFSRYKARDEEINVQLQQGASIVEIAKAFEDDPESIARAQRRILNRTSSLERIELKESQQLIRSGPWSEDEIKSLFDLRRQGHALSTISSWLRRAIRSVEKNLTEIEVPATLVTSEEFPPFPREERLFNARLNDILRGLCQHPMTSKRRDYISSKPLEEWAFIISNGIPDRVKIVLGGLTAPTYEELLVLPAVCTKDAGVYAELGHKNSDSGPVKCGIYVGSASKFGLGLFHRISDHAYLMRHGSKTKRYKPAKRNNIGKSREFVTLMTAKFATSKDVLEVRRKVVLAEAVLTIWLGALNLSRGENCRLGWLSPWSNHRLDYTGQSSHNPLTIDVVEPRNENVEDEQLPNAPST